MAELLITSKHIPFPTQNLNSTIKITNKLVMNVIPKLKRFYINDTVVTGLRLRVSPNGNKKFVAIGRVRRTNKVRTKTLGDASVLPLNGARLLAREFLSKLQSGIDANEVDALEIKNSAISKITLAEALELYVNDRNLRPKTIKGYRYEIPKYCNLFINKPITKITEDEVCQWYLENFHIPTSIDKAFRSLRAIFEYMVAIKVLNHNPCSAVTARKLRYKIIPRSNRIEVYDITKFADAWLKLMKQKQISSIQGDFILWLLMTGCRLNEARTLRWTDLDLEQLIITITDTKNGLPHILPLTPLMSDLLDRRKQENTFNNPFIFPAMQGKGVSVYKHLNDCRKTLDRITSTALIPKVRPHDLRRTFTTILDELDISESNIKSLLNHNDGSVTRKHYLQTTNIESKRRNLWEVGKYLEQSITVTGVDSLTGSPCVYSCIGSIREYIYGTSKCTLTIKKTTKSAQQILSEMR